ncbi:MAG: hypothetical protein IT379_14735 [Deltaproteobacteria bacterium]|nr:hypothetical protein [Deltaproteobacteria bacterium]
MSASLAARFRYLLRGGERRLARAHAQAELDTATRTPGQVALTREMTRRQAQLETHAVFGTTEDGIPYLIPIAALSRHMLFTGASGAGKTFGLLRLLLPLLPLALRGERSVTLVDPKGEISALLPPLLAEVVLALPTGARAAALRRIRMVDPFDPHALPPLDLLSVRTALEEGVHLRQVVSALAQATATLGIRQADALLWLTRLAREQGVPFSLLPMILNDSFVREALVARSSAEVRSYFHGRFTTESTVTRDGLGARLDSFLALRSTRLCLAAGSMLDLGAALDEGVTVVNLGHAPGGVRSVQSFFALTLTTLLIQAAFARPNTAQQPPATLVFDDVAELLLQDVAVDLERTLVLLRSRNVHLLATTQELAQLTAITPLLRGAFLTNAAVWTAFRAGPHDDHALSLMLRPTGRRLRTRGHPWEGERGPVFHSQAEEQRLLLEEAISLPARTAYVWDRAEAFGPVRLRTADLQTPTEASLPAELLAEIRRGSVAVPIPDLEARLVSERERLRALTGAVARPERTEGPSPSPGVSADAHTRRRRRPTNVPNLG